MTGQKIRYKKFLSKHSTGTRSRKKKDKAVSFLENDSEKYSAVERDQTKHKIGLQDRESREPLLYLEFNKPNEQNVYEIILFEKFNFSQSQNNCWQSFQIHLKQLFSFLNWDRQWYKTEETRKLQTTTLSYNKIFQMSSSCIEFEG